MGALLALLPSLFGLAKVFFPLIDHLIADKELAQKLKNALQMHVLDNEATAISATRDVMISDAKSESWYVRAARPTVTYWSLTVVTCICLEGYFDDTRTIVRSLKLVPTEMWYFMAASIGIYALGRSFEKAFR